MGDGDKGRPARGVDAAEERRRTWEALMLMGAVGFVCGVAVLAVIVGIGLVNLRGNLGTLYFPLLGVGAVGMIAAVRGRVKRRTVSVTAALMLVGLGMFALMFGMCTVGVFGGW